MSSSVSRPSLFLLLSLRVPLLRISPLVFVVPCVLSWWHTSTDLDMSNTVLVMMQNSSRPSPLTLMRHNSSHTLQKASPSTLFPCHRSTPFHTPYPASSLLPPFHLLSATQKKKNRCSQDRQCFYPKVCEHQNNQNCACDARVDCSVSTCTSVALYTIAM